jgi:hypothetical protein
MSRLALLSLCAAAVAACGVGPSRDAHLSGADDAIFQGEPRHTPAIPELGPLDVYAGTWDFEWEVAESQWFGPGGSIKGIERYQWLPGGFLLQMDREARGPLGDFRTVIIFGYDNAGHFQARTFSLHDGSMGTAEIRAEGDRRIWSATLDLANGMVVQERCIRTVAETRTVMSIECEYSDDGTAWTSLLRGTYRRGT